ncbi:MAG: response regulator [Litorimonas sp.]
MRVPSQPIPQQLPAIYGNILLIDDIAINHDILKQQLNSKTCKCISVNSAKKGLAVLAKAKEKNVNIDLIIVDYQMPEMTGEDFIRIAKTHADYKHIPIILFSSVDNDRLRHELKELRLEGYLTKPARHYELIRTVSTAMSQSTKPTEKAVLSPNITQETTPIETRNSETRAETGKIDVLIAEDNEVNQMFIKYIMEDMGVSFKIVPSGRLAVDKWKLLSPKIILMDISMPDWNGYEATKAIRDWEAKLGRPRTPIVAVTAHALTGDRQDCLDNDMDDYLAKPIAISRVSEMIEKWTNMTNLSEISKAS